ncbi:hypothetical protein [Phosphitispora fastidiosa]|uniref:hypothetical protein n=1 Tax=Phosphitispora fastidiosa TaxID=2837202 RepID=UPI001E5B5CB8|nr:hypothetical protein [Phosphitispora fastidiosa]MBU7007369.1 hypothetical protein [Phosphitispora fastidiosa]
MGVIGGLLGTVGMHITNMALQFFGIVKITSLQVTAALFLNWSQVNTMYGSIIGWVNHLFIGAVVGIIISLVFKYFGKDYYLLKGLGVTGLGYLVGMGFVIPLIRAVPQMRTDPLTLIGHMISYTVFGLIASYTIANYSRHRINS